MNSKQKKVILNIEVFLIVNKKEVKKKKKKKKNLFEGFEIKKIIKNNKNKLVLFIIGLLDIILIIWCARDNVANYVLLDGEDVFVGDTKNLLLGRNYITLIISVFIFIYGFFINKVLLKNKIRLKYWVILFIGVLVFNMLTSLSSL